MFRRPPRSTRPATLCPSPTLFRSREPKGAPRSASKAGLDRGIAWLMETAGVIGLAAAAGLWWAGDDRGRATMVVVAMVVLVNAMVVAVLYSIFTARRKARNRP